MISTFLEGYSRRPEHAQFSAIAHGHRLNSRLNNPFRKSFRTVALHFVVTHSLSHPHLKPILRPHSVFYTVGIARVEVKFVRTIKNCLELGDAKVTRTVEIESTVCGSSRNYLVWVDPARNQD